MRRFQTPRKYEATFQYSAASHPRARWARSASIYHAAGPPSRQRARLVPGGRPTLPPEVATGTLSSAGIAARARDHLREQPHAQALCVGGHGLIYHPKDLAYLRPLLAVWELHDEFHEHWDQRHPLSCIVRHKALAHRVPVCLDKEPLDVRKYGDEREPGQRSVRRRRKSSKANLRANAASALMKRGPTSASSKLFSRNGRSASADLPHIRASASVKKQSWADGHRPLIAMTASPRRRRPHGKSTARVIA
jgi:hypothetical protein